MDLREVVDAVFYLLRTGCQWRQLPHDFPHWCTVRYYYDLWMWNGTWVRINTALCAADRERLGREAQPSAAVIDSQSARATESAASRNQGAALENLARLRMRGFELSIDDFGTGHSSLAKLVRTPFSELKIDREFVAKVATDSSARTLVESIVAIARRLGLRTVAEGIETQAQREILIGLNCDMGQGYLFAKPMAAADWLKWMQDKLARPIAAGREN